MTSKSLSEEQLFQAIKKEQPVKLFSLQLKYGSTGSTYEFDKELQNLRKAGRIKYTSKGWVTT